MSRTMTSDEEPVSCLTTSITSWQSAHPALNTSIFRFVAIVLTRAWNAGARAYTLESELQSQVSRVRATDHTTAMSEKGQKRTWRLQFAMSALPPKAGMRASLDRGSRRTPISRLDHHAAVCPRAAGRAHKPLDVGCVGPLSLFLGGSNK